jgi:phospholipid-binding lipoprotein MlaA
MNKKLVSPILFAMVAFSNPSCYADESVNQDPLQKLNRFIFGFNEIVDKVITKPVATLYNKIMPKPLNKGVNNFFNNLNELPTIANDLLQFNFYQSANDMWRFGINSTVGIGGLFDVADRMKLKYFSNDFGLTMGRWGYTSSSYLVLPLLGPSTIRDGLGIPVDYFEFTVYPHINPQSLRWGVLAALYVDRRAQQLKFSEITDEVTLDKYAFQRNAYLQNRAYLVNKVKHLGYKERDKPQEAVPNDPSQTDVNPKSAMTEPASQGDTAT